MYIVTLKFRPIGDYDEPPLRRDFDYREEALRYGMRSSCMAGITNVSVYDYDERTPIALYNRITNYWYEFKDDNGKDISWEEFFSSLRKRTEQRAISHGFNIRIRHQGLHWKVLAGEHSIPIDQEMLPWISDAVEETERRTYEREEDDLEPYSNKVLLDMFAGYLHKRIAESLKDNPHCFSRLRWNKPFNNL